MPIFLPVALGGLALTALGLGVKRVLDEVSARSPYAEGSAAAEAMARHRERVAALRAVRQRVKERMHAYGERQESTRRETVEPFLTLLARLERWGQASAAEVLTGSGREALDALPRGPVLRGSRQAWALLGVSGEEPPPAWEPLLEWLDRGLLTEEVPVEVAGVSLYPAAACRPEPGHEAEAVSAFTKAGDALRRAESFLEDVHTRLEALDQQVGMLQGRASVQLAYLDPASFEAERPEPRERLLRLGALMGELAEALRQPVLLRDGGLAPLPTPLSQ
ncbi:hypothetical protein [Stigmatella aurantiaca]|uniref:Conserved uncharacterized protein n=1 Tax=Stigmatella aurantiaca (strain DW4/3-1) TaxID=378806 RepID=Q096I2_STIAD|nr:hypothetical protein [Stigmatella aurantiaca]ADO68734.1 conserved uncharacterized protein [Stigmatella aurantiaca DW4/3-1]EAU67679.1 hypothetical protein STIAU_0626 [Stigmatella aurantiaca DW4/3-1]